MLVWNSYSGIRFDTISTHYYMVLVGLYIIDSISVLTDLNCGTSLDKINNNNNPSRLSIKIYSWHQEQGFTATSIYIH